MTFEQQEAAVRRYRKSKEIAFDIILTAEQQEEAFDQMRRRVHGEMKAAAYMAGLSEIKPRERFTAETLRTYIIEKGAREIRGFKEDEFLTPVLDLLCLYFTCDKRFEDYKHSDGRPYQLNKGIYLYGGYGTGKTSLMRLFSENQHQSFRVISCQDLADAYVDEGEKIVTANISLQYVSDFNDRVRFFGQEYSGQCFDDLGAESVGKRYGKDQNVMEAILRRRYTKGSEVWQGTHVTTNITATDVELMYGKRIRSRFREMFNAIKFSPNAPDRRK